MLPKIEDPITRKIGQRKENFNDETISESLKKVKQLVRCDWGGKDPQKQIARQMLEDGVKCGPESVEAILKLVTKQVEGSRKRISPRIDDAVQRLSTSSEPYGDIREELP
jgi:hypothetical protein